MLKWMRRSPWNRHHPRSLSSREAFQALREREALRIERSGGSFTLLILSPVAADPQHGLQVLDDILLRRLRATDAAGFLEDGRVGILLPETSREGAEELARALSELGRQARLQLESEIHVFNAGSTPHRKAPPSRASRDARGSAATGDVNLAHESVSVSSPASDPVSLPTL